MRKINFKNLPMGEILTRDELKKIGGGNGSGLPTTCWCPGDGGVITGFSPNPNLTDEEFDNLVTERCGDWERITCNY